MQRKEKNNWKKGQLYVVGSLFIVISLTFLLFRFYSFYREQRIEKGKINSFYQYQIEKIKVVSSDVNKENDDLNYIAVLKIDSIHLEKGLYDIQNKLNHVDNNIEILEESTMPNVQNGNLILAGHNGNGKNSYFRNLHKIKEGELISIFYDGYEYQYQVMNIYQVEKTGKVDIIRNKEKTTLTLITCSGRNKQLVVISELINMRRKS